MRQQPATLSLRLSQCVPPPHIFVNFHHLGDSYTQGVHIGTSRGAIPDTSGQETSAYSSLNAATASNSSTLSVSLPLRSPSPRILRASSSSISRCRMVRARGTEDR